MDVNFSSLAPRYGTHPMTNSYIGTSGLSGGAFNWGGVWSGLKNFGSQIKNWGHKLYHSNTGQALRQKLNETGVRDKLINGIATGVNGALDIAQAELAQRIQDRLERYRPQDSEVIQDVVEEEVAPEEVVIKKRPREEEVIVTEFPPTYEEAIAEQPLYEKPIVKPPPPPTVTVPSRPLPTPVVLRPTRGWQNTLNDIVGVGLRGVKRRRCF